MSTTKPDTDTGWTDQYPHKSGAGDEYHFVRRKDGKDVVIMGFSMGKAWLNGVSYEPAQLRSHLFLGPLTPSDFEQLIRLRSVALNALIWMDWWKDPTATAYPDGLPPMSEIITALREALAHTREQS